MPQISSKSLAHPINFARYALGVKPWGKQRDIILAAHEQRRVAVRGCHSSGKSFAAACAVLSFAARYADSRVLIIAPGWLQVRSVLWHEIHNLLRNSKLKLPLEIENQTEIRLDRSLILGISTNEVGRLQGHHAAHILIIADEAPAINTTFFEAIFGILASGDSHLLLLGNPTIPSGVFYDAFGRNRAGWETITISAFDTPNLAGITLPQLLAMSERELDEDSHPYLTTRRWAKERWIDWWNGSPATSPLWQARVMAEFPSSAPNALIPLGALETARRDAFDPGTEVICGLDIAGPGKDKTALAVCCGGSILELLTSDEPDPIPVVIHWLRAWKHRIRLVRYDSCGIGYLMGSALIREGFRVEPINVAKAADDPDRFANLKAQRFWFLRERFLRCEVSGLDDATLAELASIEWTIDPHARTVIESKDSVKAAIGHSPDRAESIMLALGDAPPQPYAYITAGSLPRSNYPLTPHPNPKIEPYGEEVAAAEDRQIGVRASMGRRLRGRGAW